MDPNLSPRLVARGREDIAEAVRQVEHATDALARLERGEWSTRDELRSIAVQRQERSLGSALVEALQPLLPLCTSCEIRGEHGFRVGLVGDRFELLEQPTTISYYYDGDDLRLAERASDGDASAALSILEEWHASATVDLAVPLRRAEPGIEWRVARAEEIVTGTLQALGWWRVGELLLAEGKPLVCVLAQRRNACLQTPRLAVADFESLTTVLVAESRQSEDALIAATGSRPPPGVCRPEELAPAVSDGLLGIYGVLSSFAAASAWAWLASSLRIEGNVARLEFFGLQRVEVQLGPDGVADADACRSALQLYRWATSDASADRVLAVRQVISIYDSAKIVRAADDIRIAAEPIYRALRSTAVAEVFTAHRQAQQLAIAAARSSSDATQASAKALTERTIAALVAVGGLVLSKIVAPSIPQELYSRLALGLSAFMLALAVWAWTVEGRFVNAPVESFVADIDQLADVLADEQRSAIKNLHAVKDARRNALVVRIAAPLVYLCVAAIAFLLRDAV